MSKDRKATIYLASLANTKFGYSPATVPLEIGYIKAYAVSQLSDEVDISLYRTFESLYKAIQAKEPDIIGCSWYGWNRWLTTNALTYIKSKYPNIITVVGGANAPEETEDSLRDFKEFPCIDIIIPNEGEIPFVNLLKVFIQGGRKAIFKTAIDGVFYLSDSRVITGNPVSLTKDINIFPSPYLNGNLDQFLDIEELMPIIQTARGCPFHCLFCVSAKDSWNRVRAFDIERVKAEIKYLEAKAKTRSIRFTDENFGIVPRDLEIAKFIAENRAKTGYPSALRAYTHKVINDRIKEITLLLKDLIPMNISVQTLTGPVLENIRRKNISLDKFRSAVSWAHKNNINVTTETIFGLPGETYKSFMNVINQFVELRLDSIAIGTLLMLKETEINRPETINKYGYRVLYTIAERGYTKVNGFENIEIDTWAVESNTFHYKEYMRIKLFIFIFHLFMQWGYFKEMVYMWENRGVRIADVISEIIDQADRYPFFYSKLKEIENCHRKNLFKTKEEVRDAFIHRFSGADNYDREIGIMSLFSLSPILKGELIYSANQDEVVDEVIRASLVVLKKHGNDGLTEFLEEMEFAKSLVKAVIIPFWEMPQETVVLSSPYDLVAWRNNDYRGKLSKFILDKPAKYKFKIRIMSEYENFVKANFNKPFYLQSELFFRTFRTNNVRRFIVSE